MSFPDLQMELDALVLVVPDTNYHQRIPLLLGTNILQTLLQRKEDHKNLPHSWQLTFQALSLLSRLKDKPDLGEVKSTKPITIPPEGRLVIHGHTRISTCMRITALTEEIQNKSLPGGLRLSPTISHLEPGRASHRIPVEVTNFSSKAVTIPPKMSLCSLQLVQLADHQPPQEETQKSSEAMVNHTTVEPPIDAFLLNFNTSYKNTLSSSEVEQLEKLLIKWKDVFSLHEFDLGCTNLTKHSIRLVSDVPFKERPRKIPPAMIDEVRAHLKEMLNLGVIQKSNSPYSSNVVFGEETRWESEVLLGPQKVELHNHKGCISSSEDRRHLGGIGG